MAISVCRSYRTVSTEASLILANMLPLDLRAKQLAANFQLSARLGSSSQAHPKGHFTTIQRLIADAGLQINNCDRWNRSTLGHIPPWSTPKFEIITSISTEPELHPSHESTLHIYTDGSKSENRVGFSTVIVDQHSILLVIRGKLPEYASSYDAESVAINDALKYTLVHGQSYASVRIFTDSLSNLHSLKSNRKLSSTSISNQRLAHQAAKRTKISLEWVRGHRGIVGNELADHHAKLAATSSTTPRKFLMPLASSKLAIKSHLHCKWNQQWIESTKGSITKRFFPNVLSAAILLKHHPSYQVMQVLTFHGKFRNYLFKFKASDSPLCQCNQTPETVDHFLFDCDNFKTQRTSFKDYCLKVLKSWPPSFATITNDIKLWCEMTKYVHQTKHLILPSPQ